ncbi:hypothetical protein [Streptomyces sp. NWU339]|uniref:hypothetical protein n=1 Tax=Streptomyces sp. NWU339 TaxID=2185284 RepID=UPI0015E802F5|nr:hypothetical protein [Streptomyces sp. NWU339]
MRSSVNCRALIHGLSQQVVGRPRYARQVAETAALGVHVVRLRSGRQANAWLTRQLTGR